MLGTIPPLSSSGICCSRCPQALMALYFAVTGPWSVYQPASLSRDLALKGGAGCLGLIRGPANRFAPFFTNVQHPQCHRVPTQ